jgi:hypothetical protein
MKTIVVDINGALDYFGKGAAVRGTVKVQYADLSDWVITGVNLNLVHRAPEEPQSDVWHELVPQIADRFEDKIEASIEENENVGV